MPALFHPGYGASAGSAGAPARGIPCGGRLLSAPFAAG